MKIAIFTDESGAKLPIQRKGKVASPWRKAIEKNEEILALLKKNSLPIPEADFKLEKKYRDILSMYIRPANKMFEGSFSEVRIFKEKLDRLYQASLYIVSGRYGLLNEYETIIPYSSHLKNKTDLEKLSKRTDFTQMMLEKTKDCDVILIFLPLVFIKYLLATKWFQHIGKNQKVIMVTSKRFRDAFVNESNITILERKGLTRIGTKNRDEIIKLIEDSK